MKYTYIKTSKTYIKRRGFTLIELLIATSLSVLFVMVVSAMFFVVTVNSSKIEAQKYVAQVGLGVKNKFNYLIKNSLKLLPNSAGLKCTETNTTLSSLKLILPDGGETELKLVTDSGQDYIASNSTYLNPSNVVPNNLKFTCIRNASGETYVNYQFDLSFANIVSRHFSGFVLLRNS